jgi:hypothetical protein
LTDRAGIERFVRGTLGCTCAPQVFALIEDLPPDGAVPGAPRRISVGGRLLIHVVEDTGLPDPDRLAGWVRAGREERDQREMNRFRLVIATDDPAALGERLEAEFRRLPEVDERTHLHLVERSALPGL